MAATPCPWLGDNGYDRQFGARPLKRLIQNEVHNRLAEALLEGGFDDGDTILVDLDSAGDNLSFNPVRQSGQAA